MDMDYGAIGTACGAILLNVGLLVVALVVVRKANATAGYALAAGAGISVLATCCSDFGSMGLLQSGNYDLLRTLSIVFRIIHLVEMLAFWGCVVFAAVTLAKTLSDATSNGGARG